MCFVCSEFEGFDTDISKIIGLTRNSNFRIIPKEVEAIPIERIAIQKPYLAINSESNNKLNQSQLTFKSDLSNIKNENKVNGDYKIKYDIDFNDITEKTVLTSSEGAVSNSFRDITSIIDIQDSFDPITGLNTDTAKVFRLYNAAFQRLPTSDEINFWIQKYRSDQDEGRDMASDFLNSSELAKTYGSDINDSTYVNTLYKNVLGREADKFGMNYWSGQLNSGAETRYEVLLGFAESAENKALFTDMTGFG